MTKEVKEYLDQLSDENRKKDCIQLIKILKSTTGFDAEMWAKNSIVGFGKYRYEYESGRTGDWFFAGFSSRKQNLTIYITDGFEDYPEILKALGKFKTGKSCLYVKQLEDINIELLKIIITNSIQKIKIKYNL
ncbi:MAG: DUF1801 domain-containing protein [Cytophagales bacterium]|nr:MAG: DUF1801 domain-containing protein [Cytophagales bacterium]